jgi:cation diffusion facilitator CzcD-associated flavoprotein CzcO
VELARNHREAQVSDPGLRAQLTPDYDFGCKRILRSDDFYPALARDNVQLVTEAIPETTPKGLRTATAPSTPRASRAMPSRAPSGSPGGGVTLDERGCYAPEAYRGITVDGFPNLFLVYGPNANLNHNSVVSMLEAQHCYISQAVRYIAADESRVLDVDPAVVGKFNAHVQEELQKSAFSSECSSCTRTRTAVSSTLVRQSG